MVRGEGDAKFGHRFGHCLKFVQWPALIVETLVRRTVP